VIHHVRAIYMIFSEYRQEVKYQRWRARNMRKCPAKCIAICAYMGLGQRMHNRGMRTWREVVRQAQIAIDRGAWGE